MWKTYETLQESKNVGKTLQGVAPAAEVLKNHAGLQLEWKTEIFPWRGAL